MKESFLLFLQENRGKVCGGLVGLLVALLVAIFGFWTSLFIILCVLAGAFLGGRIESRENTQSMARTYWDRRKPE